MMKAICVHKFGGVDQMTEETVAVPKPTPTQVLVRVHAAGVGPWDAWVRSGKSALGQRLPLVLGSDFSGVVESVGADVASFRVGDDVFGVTSDDFTGGYAEYAVVPPECIAPKPKRLTHLEAASVPVVATTAWKMLFEHGHVAEHTRVLVLGAAGSVGAYAVQLARQAGADVTAFVRPADAEAVRALGAARVVTGGASLPPVDVVVDTLGGLALAQSIDAVVRGGIVVSAVEPPNREAVAVRSASGVYFVVRVRSATLQRLGEYVDAGSLGVNVGEILPLSQARVAHEMLAGRPHRPGKIVLDVIGQPTEAHRPLP